MPHNTNNEGFWIQTFTGRRLYPGNPTPDSIVIEDIAHALSLTNRFGGHTVYPYSVAQHCVNCYNLASQKYKLEALMHDAAEAYIGDLPSPIKALCPDFRVLESRLYGVIARLFHFPEVTSDYVHALDLRMLVTEAAELFPRDNRERWWTDVHWPPAYIGPSVDTRQWTPKLAEAAFLGCFKAVYLPR
jgi:hypothetical protein